MSLISLFIKKCDILQQNLPKNKIRDIYGPSLWARPAVPALANLKKTPKKSSGGKCLKFANCKIIH